MEPNLIEINPMWQRWLGRSVKVTLQDGTILMGLLRAAKPPVNVQLKNCLQHAAGSSMYLGSVTVAMENVLAIDET